MEFVIVQNKSYGDGKGNLTHKVLSSVAAGHGGELEPGA